MYTATPAASSANDDRPVFRFQLNHIDHWQQTPGAYDRKQSPLGSGQEYEFYKLPVIRVFGTCDSGQTVCAHIHGVYPYMFVEYTAALDRRSVDQYTWQLYAQINDALRNSYAQPSRTDRANYVANIVLCKAVPFYGFHVGWRYFVKIFMLNPKVMTRLADLFRDGSVCSLPTEVYEAHNPYLAQFMTDFNLFGCGWIQLSDVKFRAPVPQPEGLNQIKPFEWTAASIGRHQMSSCGRASYCELEIDVQAQRIMNRSQIHELELHNDFIERLNPIPSDFKFMRSMAELWKDERSRRTLKRGAKKEKGKQVGTERKRPEWRNAEDFKNKLEVLIRADLERKSNLSMDNYVSHTEFKAKVPNAFDVVDAMALPDKFDPTSTLSSQNYEQSFWETVDAADIAKLDAETGGGKVQFAEAEFPASQKLLKRKNIQSSSSESHEVSAWTTSSDLQGSKSRSMKEFANVTKSFNQRSSPLRSTSMTDFGRKVKHADPRFYSQDNPQNKKRRLQSSADSDTKTVSILSSRTFSESGEDQAEKMTRTIAAAFQIKDRLCIVAKMPLKPHNVLDSLEEHGFPRIVYQEPYYSNSADVPARPREYAGREFRLKSLTAPYLPAFSAGLLVSESAEGESSFRKWQIAVKPPSFSTVKRWIDQLNDSHVVAGRLSQIEGPTQKSASVPKRQKAYNLTPTSMSVMSLEVHVSTAPGMAPNPAKDEVTFVVYNFQPAATQHKRTGHVGIVVVSDDADASARLSKMYDSDMLVVVFDELDLLNHMIAVVRDLDPDVFAGYDVQSASWGYMIERAGARYDYDLSNEFSRIIEVKPPDAVRFDRWGYTHASTLKITGRHVLNLWRLLRGSVNLLGYSLQNCAFEVLKKRVPFYSNDDLTHWFSSKQSGQMLRVIRYYSLRTQLNLEFLKNQETIERTSEQARILGVDFQSVISRGSQFKVESLMFRIAKAENLMLFSPSKRQVGRQNALEYLPLVMEPKSDFYTSPVVVLDFQALYPSIMIAYNYCYSTCLGRIEPWLGRNKLGVLDLDLPDGLLGVLKDHLTVSPNGLVFVKSAIRRSLLAKMLTEILDTRVMVKNEMQSSEDESLKKLLNNRQLALKFIANVTYGYTSASFSGRMPCAEIADAIVASGREMLERAIELINGTEKWGAEVVYGDTDSLFVHLPGKSKQQAFEIGRQISECVTGLNPEPVKLKLEKVYLPCVLQTKKRYVGMMYERADQVEPVFDAKGTETVRRDGTPAEQKIEAKALKILFRTADLSQVKSYFQTECDKIMRGNVAIMDFCFAKEVRMGTYAGLLPPGAMISARKMQVDPRAGPQYGERVPYVVIAGPVGARLVDRCVSPETLLTDANMMLDAEYYITKNLIPPLERIFNLVGANVKSWYDEMPRVLRVPQQSGSGKRQTIHSYMKSSACVVCSAECDSNGGGSGGDGMCMSCRTDIAKSTYVLKGRARESESAVRKLEDVCRTCTGAAGAQTIACVSNDCPVYFARVKAMARTMSLARTSLECEW
ncbi:hypothetical protein V1512DRAFT_278509 [Lipomyces arxii]|uniref:uncharacterized protein n=1 Tax=Lipomyces arxii TaxID=56418 RepID=UPI0034CFE0D6